MHLPEPPLVRTLRILSLSLIFLFPILMATMQSSVSTIYLLLLILGSVAYRKRLTPQLSTQEKTIFIGFAVVFLIYFLGMLNSDDVYAGFKKLGKFSYFLLAVPVFLLLKQQQKLLLKTFYFGIIVSGFALLGYILYNDGATKAYHSIMYGHFSMLVVGINLLLSLLSNTTYKMFSSLSVLSALSALSASFIVGARGSWLALSILIFILVYLIITQKHLRPKVIAIFIGIILTISASVAFFPNKTTHRFNAAIANIEQFIQGERNESKPHISSSGARLILWKASIDTVKKYPFFGSGSGDFKPELRRFIKENPRYQSIGDHLGSAHNIFFEWLALFGVVGFLALIFAVFLLPLKYFLQRVKDQPDKLWAAIIGIWIVLSSMVFGLTETWITRSAPNGVYVFFVLLFMVFSGNQNSKSNST